MLINRDTVLQAIVSIHFILVSMVLMANWLPPSYVLNQATLLVLGIWCIADRGSVIKINLLMLIKFISIIIDSIAIGMYFQIAKHTYSMRTDSSYFALSVFCAILLLILKPIMLLLLNKIRQERLNDSAYDAWTPTSGYIPVDGR